MLAEIRRFLLCSLGNGDVVAEGCAFSDGRCVVCWQRDGLPGSTVVWDSIADAKRIHTGIGSWQIAWIDGPLAERAG